MTKVRGPEGFANYIRGQLSIVDGMRIDPHESSRSATGS